jgi:heme A synthase
MILGGLVSATESGLGCGTDWPLCQGRLIPPFDEPEVFLEWFHRLVAAITGLLVLGAVIASWRQSSALAAAALVLLAIQVVLGAVTVRLELPPEVSTAHLAVGTALFAVLIATFVAQSAPTAEGISLPSRLLLAVALVTFLQMVLGAYVRHSGAGLACPHPIICLPSEHLSVTVHFLHRLMALVVLGLVHAAGMRVLRLSSEPVLRCAALLALVLVVVQILLGVLSVTTLLQPHVTTTHLAVALSLLGALVYLAARAALLAQEPAIIHGEPSLRAEEARP